METNKSFENKFGNYFKSTCVIPNMSSCMETAVPIWVLLGITEEEYNQKYQPTSTQEESKEETKEETKEE